MTRKTIISVALFALASLAAGDRVNMGGLVIETMEDTDQGRICLEDTCLTTEDIKFLLHLKQNEGHIEAKGNTRDVTKDVDELRAFSTSLAGAISTNGNVLNVKGKNMLFDGNYLASGNDE